MFKVLGMQHLGFTVPDLEEAVRFFSTLFGAVEVMATGPVVADDDHMKRRLGVPAHCRIEDIRVLRVGNGTNLELFHYSGDMDDPAFKRNSQPGGYHIAFEVEDVNEATEKLRAAGVEVLEGPTYVEGGAMDGLTWVYLRTPWGQNLEIVSMQGPLGYETAGGPKMWSPREA